MTVKELIEILNTMPQDALIVSDDGTGWLAKVTKEGIEKEVIEEENLTWIKIFGNGEGV